MKLVLQNVGHNDAKPYEDAILRFLQQDPVAAMSSTVSITLRDVSGDYTQGVVWPPGTKTITDIAQILAADILAAYKDHAFRTVELEFK